MSTRKKAAEASHPAAAQTVVVDPAYEHYERSRSDFRAYDRAMKAHSAAPAYFADSKSDSLFDIGNPRTRQGFNPAGFRHHR